MNKNKPMCLWCGHPLHKDGGGWYSCGPCGVDNIRRRTSRRKQFSSIRPNHCFECPILRVNPGTGGGHCDKYDLPAPDKSKAPPDVCKVISVSIVVNERI